MAFFSKKNKDKDNEVKEEKKQDDLDESIVSRVQTMYKTAYNSKSNLHDKWKNNYKAYTGELFEQKIPEYRSDEVSNYIFSTIETIKPIMLTNNPKTQIIPQQSIFYDKARTVQAILDSEWKRTNMFSKLHLFNHLNLIYGTAIAGIIWNGKSRNGLGDVESVVISPFNFFIEPSATEIDNAEYVIYATYKKASELISSFPDKAEEIKAQTTTEVDENLMFGDERTDYGSNNILYIECYMKDYATETYVEEEIEDEKTVKYKKTKMKYPRGRRVIIAGDVLLIDEENPYEDGKFPFVSMNCYPQHGTFWGISEVEMLVSPQKHANRIMNSIIENAMLNGNPWTVMDSNCGIERNSLSNRPGLVLRKKPGTNIERIAPPPIPSYVENVVGVLKSDIENISGVYDVMRGERPGSVTAASAIQALNEQAQGRVKLKVQILENFISNIGALWIKRVQQFWVTKRTVRVAGNPLEDPTMTDSGAVMLLQNGVPMNYLDVTKDDVDGDYDIEIFAGSTMQTNKSAIAQTMIQLAQTPAEDGMPMVDRRTVLENVIDVVDSINVQEVLDYFDGMKQQQAEASQSETQMLQEQEQMKMQQEMELEQMREQHEMGIKNMEHASKLSVENVKQRGQKEMQGEQFKQDKEMASTENASKTLQEGENNVKYNQDGENELSEIIAMLSELSEEEYVELIQSNPEVAQLVEMLLKEMEGVE